MAPQRGDLHEYERFKLEIESNGNKLGVIEKAQMWHKAITDLKQHKEHGTTSKEGKEAIAFYEIELAKFMEQEGILKD